MTIARDKASGRVIGQCLEPSHEFVTSTRYALTADDLVNGNRVYLLTRDGRYVTVPRSSVRLESVT